MKLKRRENNIKKEEKKKFLIWCGLALCVTMLSSLFLTAQNSQKPIKIYIERFSTDAETADSEKKAERIESIPTSKLIRIQEAIFVETKKCNLFSEVVILNPGEKPQIEKDKEIWLLSGYFLDFKKGNQAARYLVGFGAGKQKIEVQVELKNVKTGETIRSERIVDRKVGGIFGGSDEKGLKDFAERVVEFLREVMGK